MGLKLNALSQSYAARLQRLAACQTLLKTAVRGGVLRLTAATLSYGEGVLGSRNIRYVAVSAISAVEIESDALARDVTLCIQMLDGTALTLHGVSPTAAGRLRDLITTLRK
jgi:hypothetical protein